MQHKYKTEIARLWEPEKKMELWTEIELLNLECYDPAIAAEAREAFKPNQYSASPWTGIAQQVEIMEREIGHEVEAYIRHLNTFYRTGLWHKGLASSDLVECWLAWAIQHSQKRISDLSGTIYIYIRKKASEFSGQIINGITHGQLAEPTTWGLRFRMWAEFFNDSSFTNVPLAKISGAIGSGIVTHPELPKQISQKLGISMAAISSQITPRCNMIRRLNTLLTTVLGLEKVANDLRVLYTLGHIDIKDDKIGSSSMPHKGN